MLFFRGCFYSPTVGMVVGSQNYPPTVGMIVGSQNNVFLFSEKGHSGMMFFCSNFACTMCCSANLELYKA